MKPLLSLRNLRVAYPGARRQPSVPVVHDLSMDIEKGTVLSVIGESGSGKSTVLRAISDLLPDKTRVTGDLRLDGWDGNLLDPDTDRRGVAGRKIGMVFQNPGGSLNPVISIGAHIEEVVRAHSTLSRRAVRDRAHDLLDRMGLPNPDSIALAYPHQLSGGQKQRVSIAAALAGQPSLLLADEPTTALDATVQAQILDLMLRLVDDEGIALMFVTHDLAVASAIGDKIAVMKDGHLVEHGAARKVLATPSDAYTKTLIRDTLPFTKTGAPAQVRPPTKASSNTGLRMTGIKRHFDTRGAGRVQALDGIDLSVSPGEIVGLIGESGSGKSTLGRITVGLDAPDGGYVTLNGRPVDGTKRLPADQRRAIQMVFQDPLASFNPRRDTGHGVRIPLRLHQGVRGKAMAQRIDHLFSQVGLDPALAGRRPQNLSGGQLQRAAIARALATGPSFLVCDEAVASLDVTVRAQILELLLRLRDEDGLGILFISHDLGVVQRIADRTVVLHRGKIVEQGPTARVLGSPKQAYTRSLVAAVPQGLVPWREARMTSCAP